MSYRNNNSEALDTNFDTYLSNNVHIYPFSILSIIRKETELIPWFSLRVFNDSNPCRKIREKDISKYHIQLCSSLLFMYILTLILVVLSAESVETIYGGCVSLSLLVHYFTLVAVMWMGAEALLMFQKLVIVFVRVTTKFIVIVSIVCWGRLIN